jgi:hypothetical protein
LTLVPIELSRAALLAHRNRRWDLVREAKEEYWAAQTRDEGPVAGLRAGAALWEHARVVDPSWPTNEQRRMDYRHHLALANEFRRLGHVFARR